MGKHKKKVTQSRFTRKKTTLLVLAALFASVAVCVYLWNGTSSTESEVQATLDGEQSADSDASSQLALDRVLLLLADETLLDAALREVAQTTSADGDIKFVDNMTCTSCHTDYAEQWLGSHHAQAMQVANSETVLGDFDNAEFTDFGVTSRFFKEGEQYMVHTQGEDGEYADFRVAYTFGVEPLQQYLLEFAQGRYQAFTVMWDTEREKWFSLYPHEEIAFDDELHWTDRHFTWNSSCAECHSTDLQLNFELETDSYETNWAEINVSCQSCHGPGEAHVDWAEGQTEAEQSEAEQSEARESADYSENRTNGAEMGLLVDYRSMDAAGQVETCARCHSRRYPISMDDQQAEPYLDHFMPELLREEMYHADGQILEEVYVYGSYIQSKMYQAGVSCTNCHNVHTGELYLPGNALCTTCHQVTPPTPTFPTLISKAYDTPDHHFHAEDSTGAQCVNCHMPAQNYMVVDSRRDHSLRIPRPDLSVKLGGPNACTQCHTDQEAEWAVSAMNEWYGEDWQRPHYGEVLAMGRVADPNAVEPLSALAADESQPAIVRATALDLLPAYGEASLDSLQSALDINMPSLMRVAAVQGIGQLNVSPDEMLSLLASSLVDPVRAVRIEAANALASLPTALFTQEQLSDFDAALLEFMTVQIAQTDHPEGYANLGTLFARRGHSTEAESSYRIAIERDDHFYEAYNNLVNIYYQQGRQQEAEEVFQQALTALPTEGAIYYSLGLLLAEQNRTEEALTNLGEAAHLLPDESRVQYNYGLLLEQVGRYTEALSALEKAQKLLPNEPDYLYGLITFHMKAAEWEKAVVYAEQLNELYPSVPEFESLLQSLRDRS